MKKSNIEFFGYIYCILVTLMHLYWPNDTYSVIKKRFDPACALI